MDREWKYKITTDKTGMFLMFIMTAVFIAVAIWLYKSGNSAFIFVLGLSILALVLLLTGLYRVLFYKVLISDRGFYYQTGINNGKYYDYYEVEKAWINTGSAQNGTQINSCNIALKDQRVIRFTFSYKDEESVDYLIEAANAYSTVPYAEKDKDNYIIDGKVFGRSRIVTGIMLMIMIIIFDVYALGKIAPILIILPSIIMCIWVVIFLFNYYLFFKIEIDRTGFSYRTNPFNAHYFSYNEITSCRKIKKVSRNRGGHNRSANTNYCFFFEFTDAAGKKHKFRYEDQVHAYEIDILKQRIESN